MRVEALAGPEMETCILKSLEVAKSLRKQVGYGD